jgi:hypothetical protein
VRGLFIGTDEVYNFLPRFGHISAENELATRTVKFFFLIKTQTVYDYFAFLAAAFGE